MYGKIVKGVEISFGIAIRTEVVPADVSSLKLFML